MQTWQSMPAVHSWPSKIGDKVSVDVQLQQAIAASLSDFCFPAGSAEISADLQEQQKRELAFYHQKQSDSQQGPTASFLFAPISHQPPDAQTPMTGRDLCGTAELEKKLHQWEQAGAQSRRRAEGSDASTTSAEPSLSTQEPSGVATSCGQPLWS